MKLPFLKPKQAITPAIHASSTSAAAPASATPDVDLDRLRMQSPDQLFREGMANVLDLIAPASLIISPNFLQLENRYVRTLFAYTYPRYVQTNWLSTIINYDIQADISMFVYPLESKHVMSDLKRKIGQLESSSTIQREKGMVRDPELETAIGDIEGLRDVLQRGEVKLFQLSLYFTIYATSLEDLDTLTKQLESTLGGMLIYTKQAILQMEPGLQSSVPLGIDELNVRRNLDTASLSTTFPFTSTELTSNEGILYGINRHNNSLILFDRFNLENANSVVFGTTGSGKSYAVKLEILRYLMFGTDVIIIDPENEYQQLCDAVGGNYLNLSLNSEKRINPFDLPKASVDETGEEIFRSAIIGARGLLGLMLGSLTPEEDAILEKALYETYALKDITADEATHTNPPPLLGDLVAVLANMTGAEGLAKRLTKYTEGTFAGLFNQPTNITLDQRFVVFSIRDLEEQLRPLAMYMVLTYVWNLIRSELKRRVLTIDEAWILMQHEDSANFIYAISKRARKYYLGLTTISQNVEDFLSTQAGRSVIANASMQLLLKQSPSAAESVATTFNLTDGEKYLLLESEVGEGLFFAGLNHVAIKVIASYTEDQLITTDPKQLLALRRRSDGADAPASN